MTQAFTPMTASAQRPPSGCLGVTKVSFCGSSLIAPYQSTSATRAGTTVILLRLAILLAPPSMNVSVRPDTAPLTQAGPAETSTSAPAARARTVPPVLNPTSRRPYQSTSSAASVPPVSQVSSASSTSMNVPAAPVQMVGFVGSRVQMRI